MKGYYDTELFDKLEQFAAKQKNDLIFDFPIIRIQLAFFLGKFAGNKYDTSKVVKTIEYKKLPFAFNDLLTLVKLRIQLTMLSFYNRKLLKDKVLLFGYTSHYSMHEGNELNLYLSPFKQELNKLKIEFEELLIKRTDFKVKLTRLKVFYDMLRQYHTLSFSLKAKLFKTYDTYIKNAELLKQFLVENKVPEQAHCVSIYYNAKIQQEIAFNTFKHLLGIVRPKLIWSYVYYDNDALALSRAANHCKIPVVEYQHSQQSDLHFAYAKWNGMEHYRHYFPSIFWVWSQEDAERISRNFPSTAYQPKIIAGGNLAVIQKKQQFGHKEASATNGILVSLAGEWIPEFVENIIANDSRFTWYFRLHPRYPQDKQRLIEFKNKFPGKIEMDLANGPSLYQVFTFVTINITNSSGVALEAEHFGIRNIIIGERGGIIYKNKIESGEFLTAASEKELSDLLNKESSEVTISREDAVIKERYIVDKSILNLFGYQTAGMALKVN